MLLLLLLLLLRLLSLLLLSFVLVMLLLFARGCDRSQTASPLFIQLIFILPTRVEHEVSSRSFPRSPESLCAYAAFFPGTDVRGRRVSQTQNAVFKAPVREQMGQTKVSMSRVFGEKF